MKRTQPPRGSSGVRPSPNLAARTRTELQSLSIACAGGGAAAPWQRRAMYVMSSGAMGRCAWWHGTQHGADGERAFMWAPRSERERESTRARRAESGERRARDRMAYISVISCGELSCQIVSWTSRWYLLSCVGGCSQSGERRQSAPAPRSPPRTGSFHA